MSLDPATLLTAEEIRDRYGLSAFTLRRWTQLRRISPWRVRQGPGETGLRYAAGDIVAAIESSIFDEPGSREGPLMSED